jgi:hypothetical protein
VKTGTPIWDAKVLCPEGVYVKRDFYWYEVLSRKMLDIVGSFSPRVEYFSIDEFFFRVEPLVRNQSLAQTATAIRAELPAVDRLPSAESAAAYCGLSPREFQSGTSVKRRTRLLKAGNARLRKALFMPTQTAVRFNPLLGAFFEKLVAAGKPRMQAIGACMRKLVMICYGVLKNRQPFDPKWSSRIAT